MSYVPSLVNVLPSIMKWEKGMGALDFSPFHDIWMEDFEGNLQPMDEPYRSAKEIAPGTWQVLSAGDYTCVIEGDDEAIVIDSGNGIHSAGYVDRYYKTAKYILSGHAGEGEEFYVPYEDHIASAREINGQPE